MKKVLSVFILFFSSFSLCMAQGFSYDEKVDLGNSLFKVKSGNYYGIIDANDRVVVSIEFQNILFRDGFALLTKNDIIEGVVDTHGKIIYLPGIFRVHPKYRYVYDGFILVSPDIKISDKMQWGFLNVNKMELLGIIMDTKGKPLSLMKKKSHTYFDDITPFVGGFATVYSKKGGWRHVSTTGFERFKIYEDDNRATFRSSVYKGECIIVNNDGIKLYQENENTGAVVKRILSPTATFINVDNLANGVSKMNFKEGTLTLDSLLRVVKYESGKDSIVFISKPKKVEPRKVTVLKDTLSINKDLEIGLTSKSVTANVNGRANTEIKIKNISNAKYANLYVSIDSNGAKTREWEGDLVGNSEVGISFSIPVKFSSEAIRRNIIVKIKYKEEIIEKELSLLIRRYKPTNR